MQEPASIGLNPREEKDDGDCKPMCGGAADSTGVACPGTLAKRGTSSGAAGFVVELINGASEKEGEREVWRQRKACAERWKRVSGRGRSTWRAGSEPLDGRHGERARRWRDRGRPSGLGLPQPRAIRRRTTGTGGASCLRRVGRMLELDDALNQMPMMRFNLAR